MSVDAIMQLILQTLDSINDPETLFSMGIVLNETAVEEEIKQAKLAYRNSDDIKNRQGGTETEMRLLSHAFDGELSFLIIGESIEHSQIIRRICSKPINDKEPLYPSP